MSKLDKSSFDSSFEERLKRNWSWAKQYFDRKTKEFHIHKWKISLINSKESQSFLGLCDYNTKTVFLSYTFLRGPSCGEKQIRNTILHELAHAMVGPNHN